MNHLVRRSQVGSLLRIFPCRFSIFRFPKTVSLPVEELKNEEDLLRKQEIERRKEKLRKYIQNRTKRSELKSLYDQCEADGEKMESEGVPIHKMLASYISEFDVTGLEKYLNKLEEKRPKGFALAMLRKSEPLLVTNEYYDILGPIRVFGALRIIYMRLGEKEDLRRLWNLAKDMKAFKFINEYTCMILSFWLKDDIDGAHQVLEEWDTGEHRYFEVKIKDILDFSQCRKLVIQGTELMVNGMFEEHKEEEENKKTAMEVRLNGWDPKKNLALSAYACFQYVEGHRDIESTVDVLRLLGKRESQDAIMDEDRLSRKLVEAMRGGGYIGEV
ncbi:unnamed protein product [Arabidopsis halleri]